MTEANEINLVEESEGHYVIADDQAAEWALRKIREAEAEKEKWTEFYKEQTRKVCETCDNTIANMTAMLQTYFDKVPHKVTATQENYQLPSAKLVCKRQAPDYQKNDEEVIGWLKKNDGAKYIRTEEKLDWAELKKVVTVTGESVVNEDGEIIPGIVAISRPAIFKVEMKKEANNG